MAHPDHDQVIGRLVGARLRGAATHGPGAAAPAHPDAETWAAYLDGGLQADEVRRLEEHLAGCGACRGLVGALAPEVSASPITATREAVPSSAGRAAVLPFPRRQVFAWMGIAAALFMAVTVWSVSRLGSDAQSSEMARAVSTAEPAPAGAPAGARDAQDGPIASAPRHEAAAPVDRPTTPPPSRDRFARADPDKTAPSIDARAPRGTAAGPVAGPAGRAGAAAGSAVPSDASARAMAEARDAVAAAMSAKEKRLADAGSTAAPATDRRPIPQQTQATSARAVRADTPPANQGVDAPHRQQQARMAQPPARASSAPRVAAGPPPARPAAAEAVVTSEPAPSARPTAGQRTAARPAGAGESAAARAKDEGAIAAFGARVSAAPTVFAEPGGRLQWRIVDGRRLESSSDGGVTWTGRPIPRGARLRAGAAPAIDAAWAVGEGGLVLRLSVPGGWAAVTPPAPLTLVAVSATDGRSARVTAADGQVFDTADGGATWTPVTPGAPPQ